MTFAPFSQEGRGAGWEVGYNFKGKKPWERPVPYEPDASEEVCHCGVDK